MVDLIASQSFGSNRQTKRELVTELGATLTFSVIKNNSARRWAGGIDRGGRRRIDLTKRFDRKIGGDLASKLFYNHNVSGKTI